MAHCSPAVAGECACPAHAADEYIRCRWGDKTAMRPFAKLFWTLVCCIVQADKIFTSDGLGSAKGLVLKLDSLTSPALE